MFFFCVNAALTKYQMQILKTTIFTLEEPLILHTAESPRG